MDDLVARIQSRIRRALTLRERQDPRLQRAIDDCLDADLLVFSGGSSVGERDLILDVIAEKGEILFHGIAVKPGKPTAFGIVRDRIIFGMPGYPTSCLSNAYMLLVPVLRVVTWPLRMLPAILAGVLALAVGGGIGLVVLALTTSKQPGSSSGTSRRRSPRIRRSRSRSSRRRVRSVGARVVQNED